ncbi:hypothetical protein AYI69_g6864 [Smittium culicis]|uniref:LITAF domain-containing protein n=1 Tax=Smittium culicis TaxID=133412 RepID=A0A1R1XW39_9FUNG|nr:hypothetical protein AYI69_g6864 [Smittium culicis]
MEIGTKTVEVKLPSDRFDSIDKLEKIDKRLKIRSPLNFDDEKHVTASIKASPISIPEKLTTFSSKNTPSLSPICNFDSFKNKSSIIKRLDTINGYYTECGLKKTKNPSIKSEFLLSSTTFYENQDMLRFPDPIHKKNLIVYTAFLNKNNPTQNSSQNTGNQIRTDSSAPNSENSVANNSNQSGNVNSNPHSAESRAEDSRNPEPLRQQQGNNSRLNEDTNNNTDFDNSYSGNGNDNNIVPSEPANGRGSELIAEVPPHLISSQSWYPQESPPPYTPRPAQNSLAIPVSSQPQIIVPPIYFEATPYATPIVDFSSIDTNYPIQMICPNCQMHIVTCVELYPGTQATLCSIATCLIFWPLFWVPLCSPACLDRIHTCPNCASVITVRPPQC